MLKKFLSRYPNKWNGLFCLVVITLTAAWPAAGKALVNTCTSFTTPPPVIVTGISDTLPQFPGGPEAYNRFLSKHVRYPRIAHEQNITGIVKAQYTIMPDGTVTGISILKEPEQGAILAQEIKRVLGLLPKFETAPGTTVQVNRSVSFKFNLMDEFNQVKDAEPGTKTDVVIVGYSILKKSTATY
ncbi:energy transducer TonB [Chitinophaga japonensis]|uniref:energy transducer TonB n=1 Tax=Chitinophaga japonensis TaxID=104662 RepID=UPI0013150C6D|nr:energy transducer TonB [Chitinophaga japonensis]